MILLDLMHCASLLAPGAQLRLQEPCLWGGVLTLSPWSWHRFVVLLALAWPSSVLAQLALPGSGLLGSQGLTCLS